MGKFFQGVKRISQKAAVAFGVGGAAVVAHAQAVPSGPDVSAVVAVISGGLAAIGLIGVAVLSVYGTIAIYNWVKRPIK